MNNKTTTMRKMLQKQALGYDPATIPQEVYDEIKKIELVNKVRNPTYAVSLNIAIKILLMAILLMFVGTAISSTLLTDIGGKLLGTAGFFLIGWIILRSVR